MHYMEQGYVAPETPANAVDFSGIELLWLVGLLLEPACSGLGDA